MKFQSSHSCAWLLLIACSIAAPAVLVASCSTGEAGMWSNSSTAPTNNGGGTGTAPNNSTNPSGNNQTAIKINICGEAGCAVTRGDGECDGGVTYTIIGNNKPLTKRVMQASNAASTSTDPCNQVIEWSAPDAEAPDVWKPPLTEDYSCPAGSIRVHVRDIWSKQANPTLATLDKRPFAVQLIQSPSWAPTAARAETAGCDWYSVCAPQPYLSKFRLGAMGTDSCSAPQANSGEFDISSFAGKSDVWIDYTGSSSSLPADYTNAKGAFRITANKSDVEALLCPPGKPDDSIPEGYTKLHIRWLWGDPSRTGFPGTGCEETQMGFTTPPYPTTLKIQAGGTCGNMQAMLELQNGHCPWYFALIPNSQWTTGGKLDVFYMGSAEKQVYATGAELPKREANEYWLAYAGPPDNVAWAGQGTVCMNYSNRPDSYRFYKQNPGPGYEGCGGGGDISFDPCNPPAPTGYHTVHFRYLWAGQKIFTFFPSLDLMPSWIILEVKNNAAGAEGGSENVTCTREADRPWFNCQVPDRFFTTGSTWRAVDKTITDGRTEWNTVQERDFPDKPGEYWIRWYYGKPDYNGTFKAFDYYPDGAGGDWSATGNWNDEACADKPPATTPKLGYDGWFPFDETGYGYGNGITLAATYPEPKKVQQLFNYLVQERYEIWKQNYLRYDDEACGEGTARVAAEPNPGLSEGNGYGMAISAAIGDKATFDKIWKFVRHYLSQSARKYCGGLAGWAWDSPADCRPLDVPCDPDTEQCSGNGDSAFDGDVDVAIGLVYAGLQWPEYRQAAIDWLIKMECELNTVYDPKW
ncbi:MAG TPA: glycosyl hydrolase family 8, partial [Polyangiaceae bacterium]|nr:glycosyl hydrolase family 8 [Polyangiaceae bacterium]